jgi:hypothetical protein
MRVKTNATICWNISVSDATRRGDNAIGGDNQQGRPGASGTLRDYTSRTHHELKIESTHRASGMDDSYENMPAYALVRKSTDFSSLRGSGKPAR